MANCYWCNKKYFAHDSDAGTYKEHFCSEICESNNEDNIDKYIKQREDITRIKSETKKQ